MWRGSFLLTSKPFSPLSSAPHGSRRQESRRPGRIMSNKQHVPSDSFGGISPEKKASNALRTLFTFTAVKIILAQLEGSGRGSLGSYNQHAYDDLYSFFQSEPLKDGDEWIAKLMRRNSLLALRVLEVRLAYCMEDFEYDQMERLARQDMSEANMKLLRNFAKDSFAVEGAGLDASTVDKASRGVDTPGTEGQERKDGGDGVEQTR